MQKKLPFRSSSVFTKEPGATSKRHVIVGMLVQTKSECSHGLSLAVLRKAMQQRFEWQAMTAMLTQRHRYHAARSE
jgi:hypothetical protein